MSDARPLLPCPRITRGAPCPNAAGVSGVCATHLRNREMRQRYPRRPQPRSTTPRVTWTPTTAALVLERYCEVRS